MEAHSSAEGGAQPEAEEPLKTTSQQSSNELEKENKRRHRCGRDGPGNPGAAKALHTTGVAGEGPGDGDVVHSVRTKRKRHHDRNTKRKQVLQRYGKKPPSQRKRTPTHQVFQHDVFFREVPQAE